MLDIKAVRQDPEGIAKALATRGFVFDAEHFKALDARRKQADIDSQSLLAERKSASKKIGALVGQGISVDDATLKVLHPLLSAKVISEIEMGVFNLPLDTVHPLADFYQVSRKDFLLVVMNVFFGEQFRELATMFFNEMTKKTSDRQEEKTDEQ